MVTIQAFDPFVFLVHRKFPNVPPTYLLSELHPREMTRDPAKWPEIEQHRSAALRYHEELAAMPEQAFQALLDSELAKQSEEIRDKQEEEECQRFFNEPTAFADFDHWSRAAHWTLEEAVALSFGRNPDVVDSKALRPHKDASGFAARYFRLLDLARRAEVWQKLFDPVLPGIFIAWAKQNEIEFPEPLESKVRLRGNDIGNWKTFYDQAVQLYKDTCENYDTQLSQLRQAMKKRDDEISMLRSSKTVQDIASSTPSERALSTRERDSLLKLVIGMAIGGYGYNPSGGRSEKPSEIASDLERAGLPLDPDTVRKWLKLAAEILPPNQAE